MVVHLNFKKSQNICFYPKIKCYFRHHFALNVNANEVCIVKRETERILMFVCLLVHLVQLTERHWNKRKNN